MGPACAFTTPTASALTARCDAGRLTRAGGVPWLEAADRARGVCAALAACIPAGRRGPVRHALGPWVRQRVCPTAGGYAGQDEADTLRRDPLLQLGCGRRPASGADLARQPPCSRLENAGDRRPLEALADARVTVSRRERGPAGPPARVRLALDGSADPAQGQPAGVAYQGYYRQQLSHPWLVFDAAIGQRLTAILRPGNGHGRRFVGLVLRRLAAGAGRGARR